MVIVTVVILTALILPGDPDLWSCVIYYAAVIISNFQMERWILLTLSEVLVGHGSRTWWYGALTCGRREGKQGENTFRSLT